MASPFETDTSDQSGFLWPLMDEEMQRHLGILRIAFAAASIEGSCFDPRYNPSWFSNTELMMEFIRPVAMQPSDPLCSFDSPIPGLDGTTLRQAVRQILQNLQFPWTFLTGFAMQRAREGPGHTISMITIGYSKCEGEPISPLLQLAMSAICSLLASHAEYRHIGVVVVDADPVQVYGTLCPDKVGGREGQWPFDETYDENPPLGTSIDSEGHSRGGSGSLAFSLQLRWPDGQTENVGLTCRHVLTDALDPASHSYTSPPYQAVNSPSAADHEKAIAKLEKQDELFGMNFIRNALVTKVECGAAGGKLQERVRTAQRECSEARALVTRIKSFNRRLGHVRAVSARAAKPCTSHSHTTSHESRNMDWGLITLDSKRFPYIDMFVAKGWIAASGPSIGFGVAGAEFEDTKFDLVRIGQLQVGEKAHMVGKTSGYNIGRINRIDVDVRIAYRVMGKSETGESKEQKVEIWSTEKAHLTVAPPGEHRVFSRPGDSGAPVWNENGEPAGMFFGAHEKKQPDGQYLTKYWHYVSSLSEIIEDVKDVLGSEERGRPDVVLI